VSSLLAAPEQGAGGWLEPIGAQRRRYTGHRALPGKSTNANGRFLPKCLAARGLFAGEQCFHSFGEPAGFIQ